jgi:hypothetical protein|tara:strand:+ start:696 stop:899 length:204 start_codon:yes stop_codon:yes gene_type:complete
MPVKTDPITVEWQARPNGHGAWVSVGDPNAGPHFQCDFVGDMEKGPVSKSCFACTPPAWVVRKLKLT